MTEQPKHNPPHGMEKYDLGGKDDLGALSLAQQADLNQFKVGGWRYALARKIGRFFVCSPQRVCWSPILD